MYLLVFSYINKLEARKSQNSAAPVASGEGETMPAIRFVPLTEPTPEIAAAFTRWENDPLLIPLSRPNQSQQDLEKRDVVTLDDLARRVAHQRIFLIYEGERLLGEMSYQVDPGHLLKKAPGTAWIGITIGEADGRGRGLGFQALQWLEREIAAQGLTRVELGVFEFNLAAQALYQRLDYQEIGRIEDFTYWDGLMWADIRMEKYLAGD
jgi:RimJ/RimL family protein N-acetyltransferase